MKVLQAQFYELWKIKAAVYAHKTPRGIWESCFLPIFIILVPLFASGFEQKAVIAGFISYGLFLIATLVILYKVSSIKQHHFRQKHAYQLTIFLFNIYDLSFLAITCTSFWAAAIYIFEDKLAIPVSGFLWLFFFTIVIITFLFTPYLINHMSLDRPGPLDKHLPLALAFSSAIPGLGIILSTILSRTKQIDATYYLLLVLSIIGSVLLLPIVVLSAYQIIFLGLNKWPEIKREGSKFVIRELDESFS